MLSRVQLILRRRWKSLVREEMSLHDFFCTCVISFYRQHGQSKKEKYVLLPCRCPGYPRCSEYQYFCYFHALFAPTSLISSSTPIVEASAPALQVDHLVGDASTLSTKEPTSHLTSIKRVRDEGQHYSRGETPPKGTRVTKDNASEQVNPFIKILDNYHLDFLALLKRFLILSLRQIYHSYISFLKGTIWKWLMSLITTCSKMLLSFLLSLLEGVMSWPQIVPSNKGILGKVRTKLWN